MNLNAVRVVIDGGGARKIINRRLMGIARCAIIDPFEVNSTVTGESVSDFNDLDAAHVGIGDSCPGLPLPGVVGASKLMDGGEIRIVSGIDAPNFHPVLSIGNPL